MLLREQSYSENFGSGVRFFQHVFVEQMNYVNVVCIFVGIDIKKYLGNNLVMATVSEAGNQLHSARKSFNAAMDTFVLLNVGKSLQQIDDVANPQADLDIR